MIDLSKYYTVNEAAAILKMGGQRVRVLCLDGRLKAEKLGVWYIEKDSVHNFKRLKPWGTRTSS